MKNCTEDQLDGELNQIRQIFANNGYPSGIVEQILTKAMAASCRPIGPQRCPVYLQLPWRGDKVLSRFETRICQAIRKAYPMCKCRVIFKSKPIFQACFKDQLPAHQRSNVIHLFSCRCGNRYVGKTTQRLETRIKQHIPACLLKPGNMKKKSSSAIAQAFVGKA